MTTTNTDATSPPTDLQRPANVSQAVGLLSTDPAYADTHPGLLLDFVLDLILVHPTLVMAEVMDRRAATVSKHLRLHPEDLY